MPLAPIRPGRRVSSQQRASRFKSLARHAPGTRAWFQMDRGRDGQYVLTHLATSGRSFTARAQSRRRVLTGDQRKIWLKSALREEPIPRRIRPGPARNGVEESSTSGPGASSGARYPSHPDKWARNKSWGSCAGTPVAHRRIPQNLEDRACTLEELQLHSSACRHPTATILSAVAARIERLKHLARTTPDIPASPPSSSMTSKSCDEWSATRRRVARRAWPCGRPRPLRPRLGASRQSANGASPREDAVRSCRSTHVGAARDELTS